MRKAITDIKTEDKLLRAGLTSSGMETAIRVRVEELAVVESGINCLCDYVFQHFHF